MTYLFGALWLASVVGLFIQIRRGNIQNLKYFAVAMTIFMVAGLLSSGLVPLP